LEDKEEAEVRDQRNHSLDSKEEVGAHLHHLLSCFHGLTEEEGVVGLQDQLDYRLHISSKLFLLFGWELIISIPFIPAYHNFKLGLVPVLRR